MKPNSRKNLVILFCIIIFASFCVLSGLVIDFFFFLNRPPGSSIEQKEIDIAPGTNLDKISNLLFREGVVSSGLKFKYYVLFKGVAGKLKAGKYRFSTYMTPRDVLEKLLQGEIILKKITIPEGLTVKQVARLMARYGLGTFEQIMKVMQDQEFIKELGINAPSLEGYLFPDTYFYSSSQNFRDLIKAMVDEFNKHFEEIWANRSPDNSLSKYELIILASMIEKEAMVDDERPIIAGVFINRLKKGMLLQCDPTVIYGLKNFNGNLTKKDLNTKTPYNTYMVKGLPPGPICNPGPASLKAAANPAKVKYLYFVSKNDGHHFFSETIREHINAVRQYQMKRKKP